MRATAWSQRRPAEGAAGAAGAASKADGHLTAIKKAVASVPRHCTGVAKDKPLVSGAGEDAAALKTDGEDCVYFCLLSATI